MYIYIYTYIYFNSNNPKVVFLLLFLMVNVGSTMSANAATERKSIACSEDLHSLVASTRSPNGVSHWTETALSKQTIEDDNNNPKSCHPAADAVLPLTAEPTSNSLNFLLSLEGSSDSILTVNPKKRMRCWDEADSGKRILAEESKTPYPVERSEIGVEWCDEKDNSLGRKRKMKGYSEKIISSTSESLHEGVLSSSFVMESEDFLPTTLNHRNQFSDFAVKSMRKQSPSLMLGIDMAKEVSNFMSEVEPGSQPVDLTALEQEEISMEKWVDEYSFLTSSDLVNVTPLLPTKMTLRVEDLFSSHSCGEAQKSPLEEAIPKSGELGEIFAATQEAEILEGAERTSGLFLSLKKHENERRLPTKKNHTTTEVATTKENFASKSSIVEKPSSSVSTCDNSEYAMNAYIQETRAFFSRLDKRSLIVVKPDKGKGYTRLSSSPRSLDLLSAASTKTMKVSNHEVPTVSSPGYFERVVGKIKKKISGMVY